MAMAAAFRVFYKPEREPDQHLCSASGELEMVVFGSESIFVLPNRTYESYNCRVGELHFCSNSLCSVNHSQVSTRIPNPYHTVTACDRVTSSQSLY